jgi:UDP-3-O-[3-hydroxymyristoyl] N-acetylglucosamine deacetylase
MLEVDGEAAVVVVGIGLHTGRPARARLRAWDGPVTLRCAGHDVEIGRLRVVSTQFGTTVEAPAGAFRVATVEHLFSAFGGLGIRRGVAVEVDGPELPLVDGGAAVFCAALDRLRREAGAPALRVARRAAIDVGASRYEFEPGDRVSLRVAFETDDARLARDASWDGDPDDFRARIAPARTFALARDLEAIDRLGLARHADPAAVVVVMPDAIHCHGEFVADEPARHKLLDMVGDLYLHGGPPRGTVTARRPGHGPTLEAIVRARREGIVVRDG